MTTANNITHGNGVWERTPAPMTTTNNDCFQCLRNCPRCSGVHIFIITCATCARRKPATASGGLLR